MTRFFCSLLGLLPLALGAIPNVAPSARRPSVAWGRKWEPMKTFHNVGAGTAASPNLAYSMIPRFPRTLLGIMLEKDGTSLLNSHIQRLEIFLGERSIWGGGSLNATDMQMVAAYLGGEKASGLDVGVEGSFLPIPFTFANLKELGPEQIGGLDLSTLPEGELKFEADIAAATAPQLRGHFVWGPPQGGRDFGRLMKKFIKRTYPQAASGDWYPDINVRGAILARQYWRGTLTNNAVSTAFTAANFGVAVTAGSGAISATVGLYTPVGRYTVVCVEPAVNAGRFTVLDPKGKTIGTVNAGGGATTIPVGMGSLVITIADATDFVAGDGAFLDVLPFNTDGNITHVELKKNEDNWWYRRDRAARYEQQDAGRVPMAGVFVSDYLMDNHGDSWIDTANAATLEYRLALTAADTITVMHEILADPTYAVKGE